MNRVARAAMALPLLLACCRTREAVAPADPDIAPTLQFGEFPGAARGFDDRVDDGAWQSGDTVTFALRLRKGDEVHRWLLELEVLVGKGNVLRLTDNSGRQVREFEVFGKRSWNYVVTRQGQPQEHEVTSDMLSVAVRVHDEDGTPRTRSLIPLPCDLLGRGLLPAIDCSRASATANGATEVDARPIVEAMLAMMSLLQVVQEDDALADYFWQVVEKPSIWSVVTSLGAKATMSMPFEQSLPVTRLPIGLPPTEPAYVVPLRIDVNDSPALLADVVAVDARRPYSLCAGMVAAVARHPSKPDLTFELQLLAARLGEHPPGQANNFADPPPAHEPAPK